MTTTRPQSRTLGDLLDELAAATPQAPALVSGTERLDFAALKARTDAFACALLALGIGRGDRVALLCSNRSEWVVAACAAAKLGAPVAAISTFSSPRELAYALKHSGAKALVMLSRFRDRHFLQALCDLCPELGRCPPGALQSAALPDLASVVVLDDNPSPAALGTFGPAEFLALGRGRWIRATSATSSTPRAPPPCRKASRSRMAASSRTASISASACTSRPRIGRASCRERVSSVV